MSERELKVMAQRVAADFHDRDDARALLREVKRLRLALADVRDMTGDPAIIRTIDEALKGQS